jgi:hypothetical protein
MDETIDAEIVKSSSFGTNDRTIEMLRHSANNCKIDRERVQK